MIENTCIFAVQLINNKKLFINSQIKKAGEIIQYEPNGNLTRIFIRCKNLILQGTKVDSNIREI